MSFFEGDKCYACVLKWRFGSGLIAYLMLIYLIHCGDVYMMMIEDLPLWIETDGAVQWCLGWLQRHTTAPPPVTIDRGDPQPLSIVPSLSPSPSSSVMVAIDDKHSISIAELECMYADLLDTAFEIIADAS